MSDSQTEEGDGYLGVEWWIVVFFFFYFVRFFFVFFFFFQAEDGIRDISV